ncbi:MAG: glycosyltransferase family 4 protein [Hyphomicrobiales bacterium]|nr:glycosyltransferase family 4 protein [Hyphomicrobiales bacterium]
MPSRPIMFFARGGEIDGQQRQVLYLAAGQPRGSLISIVSDAGHLHETLLALGINSIVARMSPWRSLGRMIRRYNDADRLLALARGYNIGLVHAHDVWRAEYARFVARRLRIPYVVHMRGPLSARDIRKHRLSQAATIITVAQRYVEDLVAAGIEPSRIALVDDAVDLSLFCSERADPTYVERHFGIGGKPLIGFVGRLSPFKRVAEFLEVVHRLPPDIRAAANFVIVGQWESTAYRELIMQAVTRLGLQQKVHFLERCPSEDMPQLLSSLDLLVTLSGGSIMFETMAMGKTVLSIRTDGRHSHHTRHGETAWCIDDEDPAIAAQTLAFLISRPDLCHRLGGAAREWVAAHLSSTEMVRKVGSVYAKLVP